MKVNSLLHRVCFQTSLTPRMCILCYTVSVSRPHSLPECAIFVAQCLLLDLTHFQNVHSLLHSECLFPDLTKSLNVHFVVHCLSPDLTHFLKAHLFVHWLNLDLTHSECAFFVIQWLFPDLTRSHDVHILLYSACFWSHSFPEGPILVIQCPIPASTPWTDITHSLRVLSFCKVSATRPHSLKKSAILDLVSNPWPHCLTKLNGLL